MQCSIYGPVPLMDNAGFERRTLYELVNLTVLHVCKTIFFGHSQRNLQNIFYLRCLLASLSVVLM